MQLNFLLKLKATLLVSISGTVVFLSVRIELLYAMCKYRTVKSTGMSITTFIKYQEEREENDCLYQ